TGRLDIDRLVWTHAVVGDRVAITLAPRRDYDVDLVVSGGELGIWINRRISRAERIWIKSADTAAGDASAHRHATHARYLPDRAANLESRARKTRLGMARSIAAVRLLDRS